MDERRPAALSLVRLVFSPAAVDRARRLSWDSRGIDENIEQAECHDDPDIAGPVAGGVLAAAGGPRPPRGAV